MAHDGKDERGSAKGLTPRRLTVAVLAVAGAIAVAAPPAQAAVTGECTKTGVASAVLPIGSTQPVSAECSFTVECPAAAPDTCRWSVNAFGGALVAPGGLSTTVFAPPAGDHGQCTSSAQTNASCDVAPFGAVAAPGRSLLVLCSVIGHAPPLHALVGAGVHCRATPA